MKIFSISKLSATCVAGALAGTLTASATTLADVFSVAERINEQARVSHARIDELAEETRELYIDYKRVLKEVEGLRVYNRQLEKQIAAQEREMAEINASIRDVTVIQRQIMPLMLRMIDGLDQFIELDIPFHIEERRARVDRLRDIMDSANVAVSEQFSQLLTAFQIENEYGRTMSSYSDTINVEGRELVADVLQIGRIALVYQTSDGGETGVWNQGQRQWEVLDDRYQDAVRQGIRIQRKQASVGLLPVPVRVEN